MTFVVADTSPINYLVLIGEIDLLPRLYGKVLIPDAVLSELCDPGSPTVVSAWALMPPTWLEVVLTVACDVNPSSLDPGELAAITLAGSVRADVLLLMDDMAGRSAASELGLRSTGTLGVLRAASQKGLIELDRALDKLGQTNFYLPARLVAFLRAEARVRKAD